MKKFLKIAFVVLALLLAAAVIVPMAFKGRIGEIVKREANARLTAHLDFEKLDLSLLRRFPHASLELKGLTLTGTGPFAGDTIAAADRISVVVNMLSLFGDEGFEITKVLVARPALHARKTVSGAVNWDVMKPSAPDSEQKTEEVADEGTPFRLSVRDVRISDAALRYEDDSLRMYFSSSPVSLRLRGDMSAAKTTLDLRFGAERMRLVSGGITLLNNVEAGLDAQVEADMSNRRFTFSHNTLHLNAVELALNGWADLSDADAVGVQVTVGCGGVQFKDLLSLVPAFYTKDFRNLSASGELSLAAWIRGEFRDGHLPAFEVKADVKDGMFRYSSLPKAVTGIHLTARAACPGGSPDALTLEVPAFGFTMAGNSVEATLKASHPVSDLHFDASASGRLDLGSIREVYPLDRQTELGGQITADVKVAGRLSDIEKQRYESVEASGAFVIEEVRMHAGTLPALSIRRAAASITPSAMTLGELNVTLGRSDLAANGQLTGYIGYLLNGAPLAGRLYIKSELLDLNEILASVPAADTVGDAADADTTALTAFVIPRNLDLALSTDIRSILFHKMTLTDFSGGAGMADGTLSLDRLSMKAFGGSMLASGSYSTARDPGHPALRLALDIRQASFARTFEELETVQQLVPLFRKTGGDYSMTLDMSAILDESMTPDLHTLNATGEIRSSNIRLQQVEAFSKLADALHYDPLRTIEARDVAIRFDIADGRVATAPFDLKIGGATVNLSGSTGLDQTIDYTAQVSLPAGAAGGILSKISVGIGGTFSDPKITLGVKEAATEALTNLLNSGVEQLTGAATVREAVDEQKEKIEAAVQEQKQKLSAEIERQAAHLREEAQKAGDRLVAAAEEQKAKLVSAAKNPLAKKAAEAAGGKLVEEAQRQAGKLQADAEQQIEKLTGRQE